MYIDNKDKFLKDNNISESTLERCGLEWDVIASIGEDHKQRVKDLTSTAELFVRTIQRCESVHSVRWRVKSPEHLMEKLIRKTDPESDFYSEKYKDITLENYHEMVTDLVGVRAIHLFKDQFSSIDGFLCGNWDKFEDTTVYTRKGDLDDDFESLIGDKSIKEHEAGYRSIHYVFKTKPMNREVLVEVQVRTIFEEGWSEIDHTVRYPNFSDNELVGYFLKVFNRLAGSADEMGSFVKSLVQELNTMSDVVDKLNKERLDSNNKIEDLLLKLEGATGQNQANDETISELREQVKILQRQNKPLTLGTDIVDSAYLKHARKGAQLDLNNPMFKSKNISDVAKQIAWTKGIIPRPKGDGEK
ncbi:TPA: RelA/SpoT domain-containing protein [Vibrio alginolyticus]|nr:RelA/SpoT domain-containing protein [Vibrio alginolyticus]